MLENVITIADKLSEAHNWSLASTRSNKARRSEVAKQFGLEYLGAGISRAAFRLGDYVIKLGQKGYNEKEWKVWDRCKGSPAAELLSASLHVSPNGRAIVQEYGGKNLDKVARESGSDTYDTAIEVREKLEKALKGTGIQAFDLHTGNIGEFGKVFDYGHFRL